MAQSKIVIKVELNGGQATAESKKLKATNTDLARSYEQVKKATSAANVKIQENKLIAQQANKNAKDLAAQNLRLKQSSNDVGAAFNNQKASAGLNNAILLESSRLASDASYGFQGMANNLGQLVSLFQISSQNSGGFVNVLRDLKSQILGVGGVLIAVQLLISFLPQLQKKFKELRGSVFDLNKVFEKASETVSNTAGKFEAYIATLQDATTSQREFDNTILALEKDFPRLAKQFELAEIPLSDIKDSTQKATEITDNYRESIIQLAMSRASANAIEEQASISIQARLDAEAKVREGVSRGLFREKAVFKDLAEARIEFDRLVTKSLTTRLETTELALFTNLEKIIESVDKEQAILDERINLLLPTYEAERQQIKSVNQLRAEGLDLTILEGVTIIETNNAVTDNLRENVDERISLTEKQKRQAIRAIREEEKQRLAYSRTLSSLSNLFSALGEKNKGLQIAAVVAESASSIAKNIANTQAANAIARVISPTTGGQPFVTLNNIASGLGIATTVVSARNAIKDINSGTLTSGGGGGIGSGGQAQPPRMEAPDFNIVGASQESQLAQTISTASQNPVRAFVVGKDVTTQQEMDRNITDLATLD